MFYLQQASVKHELKVMFSDHKPELNALSAIFQLTHYDQVDLCTAIEGLIRGGFQLRRSIQPGSFRERWVGETLMQLNKKVGLFCRSRLAVLVQR